MNEQLKEAHYLISEFLDGLRRCNCDKVYTARGLTDPNCTRCDCVEPDILKRMIVLRNELKEL